MQTINAILQQTAQTATPKPTATTSQTLSAKQKLKLADAWQILLSRRLVTDGVGSDAHMVFERDMQDLTPQQIDMGLRKSRDFVGFFTTPAFRELCRITPQDMGLPEVRDAMHEACSAQDWQTHNWTHPAIYHAACSVGSYDMRHMTSRELFPLFDVAYQQVVRRVLAGESLEVAAFKALPESVHVPASEESARAKLARIKELLK